MFCAIWYHLYNLKNVKNTHGVVLLLVKLQAYFTKSNTPSWVFLTFFKLYKWYQIVQRITYNEIFMINSKCFCISAEKEISFSAINDYRFTLNDKVTSL